MGPFLKNIFENTVVGKLFEKLTATDFLSNVAQGINTAKTAVQSSTAQIEGRALAPVIPINGGGASRTNNNKITNQFTVNADSLTKEESIKAIESGVQKSMDGVLRETERDVTPAAER